MENINFFTCLPFCGVPTYTKLREDMIRTAVTNDTVKGASMVNMVLFQFTLPGVPFKMLKLPQKTLEWFHEAMKEKGVFSNALLSLFVLFLSIKELIETHASTYTDEMLDPSDARVIRQNMTKPSITSGLERRTPKFLWKLLNTMGPQDFANVKVSDTYLRIVEKFYQMLNRIESFYHIYREDFNIDLENEIVPREYFRLDTGLFSECLPFCYYNSGDVTHSQIAAHTVIHSPPDAMPIYAERFLGTTQSPEAEREFLSQVSPEFAHTTYTNLTRDSNESLQRLQAQAKHQDTLASSIRAFFRKYGANKKLLKMVGELALLEDRNTLALAFNKSELETLLPLVDGTTREFVKNTIKLANRPRFAQRPKFDHFKNAKNLDFSSLQGSPVLNKFVHDLDRVYYGSVD